MGGYKEYKIFDMLKRKSIIIRYIVFIILIFVVTAMFNVQLTKERKIQKDIVYTENSNLKIKDFPFSSSLCAHTQYQLYFAEFRRF